MTDSLIKSNENYVKMTCTDAFENFLKIYEEWFPHSKMKSETKEIVKGVISEWYNYDYKSVNNEEELSDILSEFKTKINILFFPNSDGGEDYNDYTRHFFWKIDDFFDNLDSVKERRFFMAVE